MPNMWYIAVPCWFVVSHLLLCVLLTSFPRFFQFIFFLVWIVQWFPFFPKVSFYRQQFRFNFSVKNQTFEHYYAFTVSIVFILLVFVDKNFQIILFTCLSSSVPSSVYLEKVLEICRLLYVILFLAKQTYAGDTDSHLRCYPKSFKRRRRSFALQLPGRKYNRRFSLPGVLNIFWGLFRKYNNFVSAFYLLPIPMTAYFSHWFVFDSWKLL